jgi:phosphogluconate dehydratase
MNTSPSPHPTLAQVTARITERSAATRSVYMQQMNAQRKAGTQRHGMGCANMAHAFAAMPETDKRQVLRVQEVRAPHLGIVTAYNDMLSAHQPYEDYPEAIRAAARACGATAQVAGGVPAMCDGVTQGAAGMELSLFSRDVIALATAVALSHNVFDAALCLGVCDKIVPGLLMGALQFGHLPTVFVPAGPMTSGLSNSEKSRVRQLHAKGEVGRDALLAAEAAAYHSAGTCTFYGTANSNQMLMEFMGLHLPGSSFVNPGTPLRAALTAQAVRRAAALTGMNADSTEATAPVGLAEIVNERCIVNAMVGLLHADVQTIVGPGLHHYTQEPWLDPAQDHALAWRPAPEVSGDDSVVRPASRPFSADGGLRLLQGNLGRSVVKVSAVAPQHRVVRAPAVVVHDQQELLALYQRGELNRDFVAVVRYQGPRANGMPELHKLTPPLANLQDQGFAVALVTDGRMSGASGKVPAAIHLSPEALADGPIARVHTGDWITLDCERGVLELEVDAATLAARAAQAIHHPDLSANAHGTGRELFGLFRHHASTAESGASPLFG